MAFKSDDCVRITFYIPIDGHMQKASASITNGFLAQRELDRKLAEPNVEPTKGCPGYIMPNGSGYIMEVVGDSYNEYLDEGYPLYKSYLD